MHFADNIPSHGQKKEARIENNVSYALHGLSASQTLSLSLQRRVSTHIPTLHSLSLLPISEVHILQYSLRHSSSFTGERGDRDGRVGIGWGLSNGSLLEVVRWVQVGRSSRPAGAEAAKNWGGAEITRRTGTVAAAVAAAAGATRVSFWRISPVALPVSADPACLHAAQTDLA